MKKLNKQRNQIIILSVLLLIMGVANYFNYYAPEKPVESVVKFSELSSEEQENLINSAKQNSVHINFSLSRLAFIFSSIHLPNKMAHMEQQ